MKAAPEGRVDRFVIGADTDPRPGDCVVALSLDEVRAARAAGRMVVTFDKVLARLDLPRAPEIWIDVPSRRGYSFVRLLEWLVGAVLGEPGRSTVTWRAGRKAGATGLDRILAERGWRLRESRTSGTVQFVGQPPDVGEMPQPALFSTTLEGAHLQFYADWGVFSSADVDDGTRLLLSAAAARSDGQPVVADVGTGYGPLGVGLVACGRAARVIATEVDAVALALVRMNAAAAGAEARVVAVLEDDPAKIPPTDLTVCNFPTHARRDVAEMLAGGLCARARTHAVLTVVHRNLEGRFASWFERFGARVEVVHQSSHSVLALRGARG